MCLGKILLQEPDLVLLDEPTNHLDLDALEWLEGVCDLLSTDRSLTLWGVQVWLRPVMQ